MVKYQSLPGYEIRFKCEVELPYGTEFAIPRRCDKVDGKCSAFSSRVSSLRSIQLESGDVTPGEFVVVRRRGQTDQGDFAYTAVLAEHLLSAAMQIEENIAKSLSGDNGNGSHK
jgi:hypothetical protein